MCKVGGRTLNELLFIILFFLGHHPLILLLLRQIWGWQAFVDLVGLLSHIALNHFLRACSLKSSQILIINATLRNSVHARSKGWLLAELTLSLILVRRRIGGWNESLWRWDSHLSFALFRRGVQGGRIEGSDGSRCFKFVVIGFLWRVLCGALWLRFIHFFTTCVYHVLSVHIRIVVVVLLTRKGATFWLTFLLFA